MNSKSVNLDGLNKIYKNEILRWSVEGQYNEEWMSALRKAEPGTAEDFVKELNAFQFQKVEVSSNNLQGIVGIASAAAGAVLGAGAGLIFKFGAIPLIATGIGTAVVGGVVGSKISNSQKEKYVDAEINSYKKQLDELGEKLLKTVKKADGKEPLGI